MNTPTLATKVRSTSTRMSIGSRSYPRLAAQLVLTAAMASCTPKNPPSTQAPAAPAAPSAAAIDPDRVHETVAQLASDGLGGRFSLHTADIGRAADYLAHELAAAGVAPVGPNFRHDFDIVVGAELSDTPVLSVQEGSAEVAVDIADFAPVGSTGSGTASGELVFVGYAAKVSGDEGPDYNDLADIDLQGKIALLLLDAPLLPDLSSLYRILKRVEERFESRAVALRESNDSRALRRLHLNVRKEMADLVAPYLGNKGVPKALLKAPEDPTDQISSDVFGKLVIEPKQGHPNFYFAQSLRGKLARVQAAGAVGAIVVRGPASFVTQADRDQDALPNLQTSSRKRVERIPVVRMKWRTADAMFDIAKLQRGIDRRLRPNSAPTGHTATLSVATAKRTKSSPNVLGMIPGGDLAHEYVLFGAHYDHIGTDEPGHGYCKSGRTRDVICNGADDNASGTAVVLEIARVLGNSGFTPRRTLVFAFFSGEELGLRGSQALADHPPDLTPFAKGHAVAMVNLDMVGRLGARGLIVGGLGSSSGWLPLFDAIAPHHNVPMVLDRSVTSRSDHASFYKHGIPVVFLFTGVHEDYHKPGDESDRINVEGLGEITKLTYDLAIGLAAGAAMPFTRAKRGDGLVSALPGDRPESVIKKLGFGP